MKVRSSATATSIRSGRTIVWDMVPEPKTIYVAPGTQYRVRVSRGGFPVSQEIFDSYILSVGNYLDKLDHIHEEQ